MWREIEGFDGRYAVSDQGEIRVVRSSKVSHIGRILKQRPGQYGYLQVDLWDGEKFIRVRAHREVAKAFLGDPGEGYVVCHNNGDKLDNRRENLRWDTQSSNNRDMLLHGTHHNRNKTHCKQGHEFTEENTYWQKGKEGNARRRFCRACGREATRRYQSRKRAEA